MKMQIRGTHRLDCLGPLHSAPKVAAAQRAAASAGEHQRIMIPRGVGSEMLANVGDDHFGQHDCADASTRFRRADDQRAGVELDVLAPHRHRPGVDAPDQPGEDSSCRGNSRSA